MSKALRELSAPAKRNPLSQHLQAWRNGHAQEELLGEIEPIRETFEKNFGHRWTCLETQRYQGSVLSEYRTWMSLILGARGVEGVVIEPDSSPEANDHITLQSNEGMTVEYVCK